MTAEQHDTNTPITKRERSNREAREEKRERNERTIEATIGTVIGSGAQTTLRGHGASFGEREDQALRCITSGAK